MADFIRRNIPVFAIGLVTIAVFIIIIFTAAKNPTKGPGLQKIEEEILVTDTTATIGPRDSKVVLVEFSDFECPACKSFHPVISSLIDKYKDRVLFAYKHFPLPMHAQSRPAAIAAIAAQEQGKFWEYADKLFDLQPDFTRDNFITAATELSLDVQKFTADLDNADFAKIVDDDYAQAQRIGLSATPTFILNDTVLELSAFDDLEKAIKAELEKNNIAVETVQESTQTTQSAGTNTLVEPRTPTDTQLGVINIKYDTNGFYPPNVKGLIGQLVRITNTTAKPIEFQQIITHFTHVNNPFAISAGETVEFRLHKEGLWTFKEASERHYGSVFSVAQE